MYITDNERGSAEGRVQRRVVQAALIRAGSRPRGDAEHSRVAAAGGLPLRARAAPDEAPSRPLRLPRRLRRRGQRRARLHENSPGMLQASIYIYNI